MDLPLTSSAIPAFVHPRRARQLHILQFRFLQSAHTPRRGIRFRCLTPTASFPLPPPPTPPPSPPSQPFFFFLLPLSSSLFSSLLLSSYFAPFSLAFRLRRFFAHQTTDTPPVQAHVSGLRLFLVYRFPFFVKVSDTLIRCVVLFPFLHHDYCFVRSRCNYLYLSSRDNVLQCNFLVIILNRRILPLIVFKYIHIYVDIYVGAYITIKLYITNILIL